MAIRLVLVDDQRLFREAMRLLLGAEPDLEVVGEAHDGASAITMVERLLPDVVLMDVRMPRMDGVEATRRILAAQPQIKIVALTTFDDDQLIFDILREGAVGYLLKDAGATAITSAVRSAASGQSVLTPAVTTKVVSEFARMARLVPRPRTLDHFALTEREVEVLRLLARGASNKEIGGRLHVAEGTVKNHLTSIFRKLDVSDRVHAAIKAREYGLV